MFCIQKKFSEDFSPKQKIKLMSKFAINLNFENLACDKKQNFIASFRKIPI